MLFRGSQQHNLSDNRAPKIPRPNCSILLGIGTHYRTLERVFRREIGISPKFYGRIQRLNAFIRRLRLVQNDWSEIAFDLGYSDQAHLIRDVVQLTDYTPTNLARLTAEHVDTPIWR